MCEPRGPLRPPWRGRPPRGSACNWSAARATWSSPGKRQTPRSSPPGAARSPCGMAANTVVSSLTPRSCAPAAPITLRSPPTCRSGWKSTTRWTAPSPNPYAFWPAPRSMLLLRQQLLKTLRLRIQGIELSQVVFRHGDGTLDSFTVRGVDGRSVATPARLHGAILGAHILIAAQHGVQYRLAPPVYVLQIRRELGHLGQLSGTRVRLFPQPLRRQFELRDAVSLALQFRLLGRDHPVGRRQAVVQIGFRSRKAP